MVAVMLGTGAGLLALPYALAAFGFGAGGIIAGSWAALWQSLIGNVSANSIFSFLTSIGMGGLKPAILKGLPAVISFLRTWGIQIVDVEGLRTCFLDCHTMDCRIQCILEFTDLAKSAGSFQLLGSPLLVFSGILTAFLMIRRN